MYKFKVQKEVTVRVEIIRRNKYINMDDLINLISLFAETSESLNSKRDLNSLSEALRDGKKGQAR